MIGDVGTAEDLTAKSAADLASLVQRGAISPVEAVQAHLERIERLEPAIQAFQAVRAEAALADARELAARRDLADLPLAGVPVAIKDNVDVAGEPTRQGSAATSSRLATRDDELVRRLRAAGCVVIGKTRMPELAIWPFTEPEASGATHNPWDATRSPGGSTGGGAAAVAAGMVALALGSDGGGSLRVPAACCGIVGLKPGSGVVPLAGGLAAHWYGMTEFGPLARTVSDAALMLDVLAGRSGHASATLPDPHLRIAVSTKSPTAGAEVSDEVKGAVEATASLLRGAGHEVIPGDPPYPVTLGWRFSRRWLPGIAEDVSSLPDEGNGVLEPRTRSIARVGRWLQRRGLAQPAAADPFAATAATWLSSYDLLLMPTIATTAVPIGKWRGKSWVRTTLGVANWICTTPWNVAGFPAMSVPAGLSGEGLPLAVQLVGPPGSEGTMLPVAKQLEAQRPWPQWQG